MTELAVVLAVAVLMIGLLLPAMSQVRANLHQIICSSNLRQIGIATLIYVDDYNERMPHSAFKGQTPDEMYFGQGAAVPDQLAARRKEAWGRRLERNRRAACDACPRTLPPLKEDEAA